MEERYNESTINRPEGERLIDAPLIAIDILERIKQLKTEAAWEKNDRNAITLFKSKTMRIVLVAMHDGAEMRPQSTDAVISLHVLEGHLLFETDEETIHIRNGQLVTLHALITHRVKALEESTFLLTMTDENYGKMFY